MSMNDNEIKRFLTIQSHERFAKLFIDNCTSNIKVFDKGEVYIYNTEFNYYQLATSSSLIMNIVSKVLHAVIEQWQNKYETEQMDIAGDRELEPDAKKLKMDRIREILKHCNVALKNIETTSFIKNIIEQVLSKLTLAPEEINELNYLPNYLNFKNGKLCLKTLTFSSRTPDDFITEYLPYDYNPVSDKKTQEHIKKVLKQICNNKDEDLEFILSYLGYCITSETKEQKYLNAYGASASNGKSTIIKIMESVFSIYTFKATKQLFSESFGKSHKYFSGMKGKRIVYIEELDKKKTDGELLKDVVDGNKMENEVLFGTTEKINILFKLLFFSNNLMNFDADQGIKRRMIAMEFTTIFADAEELEEKKATYPNSAVFVKDMKLLETFKNNDDYKNAFLNLIVEKAKLYFEKGLIIPDASRTATNELCDENDKMQQYIDNHFEKTGNDADRICKDEFKDLYSDHTKCNHAWTSILSDIKRIGLNYDGAKRAMYKGASIRGALIGIKKKFTCPFNDRDTTHLDKGVECDKDKQIQQLYKENVELKRQIEELKKQMQPKEVKEKPKIDINKMVESCNDFGMTISNVQKQFKQINKDMKKVKSKEVKKESIDTFLDDLDALCN